VCNYDTRALEHKRKERPTHNVDDRSDVLEYALVPHLHWTRVVLAHFQVHVTWPSLELTTPSLAAAHQHFTFRKEKIRWCICTGGLHLEPNL
jgi:hypothetical protein